MKHIKLITLYISITLYLSSCISFIKVPLTECGHPSGWCKEVREVASKSWKYAQLCKNVYNKQFQFKLDNYFEKIEDFENKNISFFASLYKEKSTGQFVFILRGTDSLKDFGTGNNPFKQKQNEHALKVYDNIKEKYKFTNCVAAGHSLGGGIAVHISLNRENVETFSFNGSPVFRNKNRIVNDRYSIVENGEILKLTRIFGREADQLYTSIGCSKGNAIGQHDMKSLALCLTQIAASKDPEATESLILNSVISK